MKPATLRFRSWRVSAPVLQYPGFSLPFCLMTDASEVGISGVLSQTVNGVSSPVDFFSSSISRTQRNYSTTDRECLVIVEAIRHFDIFLAGEEFRVCKDLRHLAYLQSLKETRGRLARWLLYLNFYQFKTQYNPVMKFLMLMNFQGWEVMLWGLRF